MKSRYIIRFLSGPLHDRTFEIGEGESKVVGKSEGTFIRIDDDVMVSRSHAKISVQRGQLWIEDLGSRNGTFINGKKIERKTRISAGDKINVGQVSCFQCSQWNALEPSRFASAVMTRVTDFSKYVKRRPRRSLIPQFLMLQLLATGVVGVAWYVGKKTKLRAVQTAIPTASQEPTVQPTLAQRLQSPPTQAQIPEAPRNFIWDEIVTVSRRFGDTPPSALDSQFQKKVEFWIDRFTKNDAHKKMFEKKQKYWSDIQSALTAQGLPVELGYLVWVESEFNVNALSPVGALGLWQFMPATARDFGLRVEPKLRVDERLDVSKSSKAAAEYLSMLLKQFGTDRYMLAIASYNAGQNKIERKAIAARIRRAPKPDFWALRDQLPEETVDYVPKVLAAIIINRNPDRW
ncbi:MAG: transglycosylase SLT domain-containing protein [Silvanigrellaceae bacterium]